MTSRVRHLNFTGRRRIRKQHVPVSLGHMSDGGTYFDISLGLDPYRFPDEAPVFVEAYVGETVLRFPWGTVGGLEVPKSTSIDPLILEGRPLFRVKVLDPSGGSKLIGLGDKIPATHPDDGEQTSGLLLIQTRDLGESAWKIETEYEDKVVLVLNKRIPDIRGRLRSDPLYRALIVPEAVRSVFRSIVWTRQLDEADDKEWMEPWLTFAEENFGYTRDRFSQDPEDALQAIEDFVEEFSRKNRFCSSIVGEEGA